MTISTLPNAVALSPSEQILLDAESHSPANDSAGVPVLRTPGRFVDSGPIAEAMWAAALLANEAAGAVRLEMGVRSAWFGLSKKPEVQVRAAGPVPAWPARSLEESLAARVVTRSAKGKHDARGLFADEIDRDTSPHLETALRAIKALLARGLAQEVESQKTTLRVFKSTVRTPVLTPAGETVLQEHPPAAAAQLLTRAARERADVHAALLDAIRHTLSAKTIDTSSDSGSNGGDSSSSD
jgi:hypothetical protein